MTSSQISHDVNDKCLKNCDETQVELMKEVCILVDEKDKKTGSASKKQCHLVENGQIGIFFSRITTKLCSAYGSGNFCKASGKTNPYQTSLCLQQLACLNLKLLLAEDFMNMNTNKLSSRKRDEIIKKFN